MPTSAIDLSGRVALVTGSTRGIGWAVARQLAACGAALVLNGCRSQELLEKRVRELEEEFSVPVLGVLADAADPGAVSACYRRILSEFKGLHILVNNAGVLEDALLGMIAGASLERVLSINTAGVIHHLQAAARLMRRAGGGAIVNLSSIVGLRGNPGQVAYGASKAAVVGITLAAAKELAPDQIRVNAVAPGLIDTEMIAALPEDARDRLEQSIGLGRIGQPGDVARVVLFLVSELAAYVTGQVLGVDGGMVI